MTFDLLIRMLVHLDTTQVKVKALGARSHEEHFAKVVGATSSEGLLVLTIHVTFPCSDNALSNDNEAEAGRPTLSVCG